MANLMRKLVPADYRVIPWKNGGGTTTEIFIHPEGAGWDTFEWRAGIADIAQSGPFSSFPGIDRSILLRTLDARESMLAEDGRELFIRASADSELVWATFDPV
jgi:environmental stress-induced protein Ves